jgi:hypothetical protein
MDAWEDAMKAAALHASALGEAMEVLAQTTRPPAPESALENDDVAPAGAPLPEPSAAAPAPPIPSEPAAEPSPPPTAPLPAAVDAPTAPAAPVPHEEAAPTEMIVSNELMELAAEVARRSAQFQVEQNNAGAIQESLTSALSMMNDFAAHSASQAEVRELSAQVEQLRSLVNNLQSRVNASRTP